MGYINNPHFHICIIAVRAKDLLVFTSELLSVSVANWGGHHLAALPCCSPLCYFPLSIDPGAGLVKFPALLRISHTGARFGAVPPGQVEMSLMHCVATVPFKIASVRAFKQGIPVLLLGTQMESAKSWGLRQRSRFHAALWLTLRVLKWQDARRVRLVQGGPGAQAGRTQRDRLQRQAGFRNRQPDIGLCGYAMHFKTSWWERVEQGYAEWH